VCVSVRTQSSLSYIKAVKKIHFADICTLSAPSNFHIFDWIASYLARICGEIKLCVLRATKKERERERQTDEQTDRQTDRDTAT